MVELSPTQPAARRDLAARAASFAIAAYIRLVDATTRWRIVGREFADPLLEAPDGFILAFWHQRLLMSPLLRRETSKRVYMLISHHRDGEIIADAVKGFDIDFIRGSTADPRKKFKQKGGAPAIAQMIAALQAGAIVGVTPDGPRGPARKVQPGVIKLAQLSGAPILPVSYAVTRGRFLDSWDRFLLALPFSRGAFAAAEPLRVPVQADAGAAEAARRELEQRLDEAGARAEAALRRPPDGSVRA
ncbi:MAG: DUF374 domain-containing protein [Alphaproteobacteria bacterium]|nr:DUF374 domain-containing protein [Alphaproteobacteria bacterium]